jgi:hypothetical protein
MNFSPEDALIGLIAATSPRHTSLLYSSACRVLLRVDGRGGRVEARVIAMSPEASSTAER